MERPDPKELELRHETEGAGPGSRGRFELRSGERTFAELGSIRDVYDEG